MNAIRTRLTLTAGLVIAALTAAAFWLSYAHLHDVAAASGLGNSPARAWAWPATLDLFIVAGEIMMLVAALAKRRDGWAITLTVAGSVGSIGLNVFGVGSGAPLIHYVVAAVPPSAALLAFGALMRQIHAAVAQDAATTQQHEEAKAEQATQEAANATLPAVAETSVAASPLSEVLSVETASDDVQEPDERTDEDVTPVFTMTTKPTMPEISAAVLDIERDGTPLSGKALARYFGVSDRSGRRYLTDWKADQGATA